MNTSEEYLSSLSVVFLAFLPSDGSLILNALLYCQFQGCDTLILSLDRATGQCARLIQIIVVTIPLICPNFYFFYITKLKFCLEFPTFASVSPSWFINSIELAVSVGSHNLSMVFYPRSRLLQKSQTPQQLWDSTLYFSKPWLKKNSPSSLSIHFVTTCSNKKLSQVSAILKEQHNQSHSWAEVSLAESISINTAQKSSC